MLKNIYIAIIVFLGLGLLSVKDDLALVEKVDRVEGQSQNNSQPIVVLELFTSQGCSSCPPADVLLQKVKEDFAEDVYALSYHVDYWNYIGWRDPFSQSKFTKNQRQYNIKFRNNSNYTPQLVVNGKAHFVGSDASKMYAAIDSYRAVEPENSIKIFDMKTNSDRITFDYGLSGPRSGKRMRILLVLDERVTKVKRGENKNRILRNSNIVIAEKSFELNTPKGSVSIDVPEIVKANEKISLIVLVEKENLDIVGASKLQLES